MAKREKSYIPGVVLIIIGTLFLFNELNIFNFRWRHLYPILMLGGSVLFLASMLTKKRERRYFSCHCSFDIGVVFLTA